MSNKNGFSLVELLMVIAIIGILSTIVLNSISKSRARAYDSKIQQQLSSFRTAAEIYFSNQDNYGPATSVCSNGIFNDLTQANGSPGKFIDPGNLPPSAQRVCQSTDSTYAVKVSLYSGTEYWCIDNRGISKPTTDNSLSTYCP
jgi:prepilin-type N-terminal cleavage/methylation domain-containing protein